MLNWVISSSVLILIIIVLRFCLKGKMNLCLQYALWGLVLVRLLVPFSFGSSALSVSNLLPERIQPKDWVEVQETEALQTGQSFVPSYGTPGENHPQRPEPIVPAYTEESSIGNYTADPIEKEPAEVPEMKTSINWWELANVVWVLGFVLVGSVLLTANVMFAVRLKKSRKEVENTNEKLRIYCSEALETPCLFGIFRPAVYLTPEATESETVRNHVLEHEKTHYRHGDHIWAILRGVCLAVHWYNPLVWWAASLSKADAELACDEATIKRIGEQERAEYGRTLLGMTCRKRTGLLVASTTMTGSKKDIKERVLLLVKKPQMAAYTLVAVVGLALFAVGCTFTGETKTSGEPAAPSATVTVTPEATPELTPTPEVTNSPVPTMAVTEPPAPTEAVAETVTPTMTVTPVPTEAIAETEKPVLLMDVMAAKDALYFATHSIWESTAGGDYIYAYYSNQEAVIAALEKAKEHVQENKGILKGDVDSGIYVVYQDEWWMLTEEGALNGIGIGRIEPEYTKELVAICEEAEAVWNRRGPVRPENIKGITKATLFFENDGYIINKEKLAELEQMLSQAEPLYGGSACPFTTLLNMELESGKQLNILLATDSCGVWMSEGAFYQYAGGNEELFALFTNQNIMELMKELDGDVEKILAWLPYASWEEYAGYTEMVPVLSLLHDIRFWAKQEKELTQEQICLLMSGTKGLDCFGATTWRWEYEEILKMVYEKNEQLFADCWISKIGEQDKDSVTKLMADVWNISVEDAETLLEEKANEPEKRVRDFRYFENDDGTLTIIKYIGSGRNVAVPEQIGGRWVTVLGADDLDGVFENCSTVQKITVPASVKKISSRTFAGCERLKTVVFADTVEQFGDEVFLNCQKLEKLYFEGNMPEAGTDLFDTDSAVVVLYPKENTSWTESWCGRETWMY